MEKFIDFVSSNIAWGPHLIILILSVGVYFTIKLNFVQIRHLKKGFKLLLENDGSGEISRFGALCTSLAATIGTGNIVGVASALSLGGPGALFWMVVAAFFGMATIFAEGLLSVKYRQKKNGSYFGGPFYYIEMGLGSRFRGLAVLFAVCGVIAGTFGIGTIIQANSISSAVAELFKNAKTIGGHNLASIICGVIITLFAALVIIGGIRRISKVSEIFVPFMSLIYVSISLTIIITNIKSLPSAIGLVLGSAFNPKAILGGGVGITFLSAVRMGTSRGVFSNEAGLGSAPIAAAAARGNEPTEQGLVSMLGTFIDTIVLCTITGLGLVVTNAWNISSEGVEITAAAWKKGLPLPSNICDLLLLICLIFFAFSSIIGWNYYTERCLSYLCHGNLKIIKLHRLIYILAVLIGPFISAGSVWGLADIFNAFMALPNILALILLRKDVIKATKGYFARKQ